MTFGNRIRKVVYSGGWELISRTSLLESVTDFSISGCPDPSIKCTGSLLKCHIRVHSTFKPSIHVFNYSSRLFHTNQSLDISYTVEEEEKVAIRHYQVVSFREALKQVQKKFGKLDDSVSKWDVIMYFGNLLTPKKGRSPEYNLEEFHTFLQEDFDIINDEYPMLWEKIFQLSNQYYSLANVIFENRSRILRDAKVYDMFALKALMRSMIHVKHYDFLVDMLRTRFLDRKLLNKMGYKFIMPDKEGDPGNISTEIETIPASPMEFRKSFLDELAQSIRHEYKHNKSLTTDRAVHLAKIIMHIYDEKFKGSVTESDCRFSSVSMIKLAIVTGDIKFAESVMNSRIIPLINAQVLSDENFFGHIFSGYFLLLGRSGEQRRVRAYADYFLSDTSMIKLNNFGLVALLRALYHINDYERVYLIYHHFPQVQKEKIGPIIYEKSLERLGKYPERLKKFQAKVKMAESIPVSISEDHEEKKPKKEELAPIFDSDGDLLLQAIEYASKPKSK